MRSDEKCADQQRLRINAKKCLYEGQIVPRTLYGAETWGM